MSEQYKPYSIDEAEDRNRLSELRAELEMIRAGANGHTPMTKQEFVEMVHKENLLSRSSCTAKSDARIKFRLILRWDDYQKKYRVFELAWCRGVYAKGGYTAKLTLAICPRILGFKGSSQEWWFSFLGAQWHYRRYYGSATIN